jgi:acyl carrier protein
MSGKPSQDAVFGWVCEILKREFQLADSELTRTAHLIDDLDLDSIDAIDLSVRLEEKTGVAFKEEDLKGIRTIGDVVDFISQRLA